MDSLHAINSLLPFFIKILKVNSNLNYKVMPIRINFNDVYTDIKTLAGMVGENMYDAMIAISGGGLIPARLLRTHLKIPVYSVCVVSYDENDTKTDSYNVLQWLSEIYGEREC